MPKVTQEQVENGGILRNRSCTDILMLLLYIIFLIGWIVIAVVAFNKGKPSRILLPANFRGDLCGDGPLSNFPFLFVPKTDHLTYGFCTVQCPGLLDYVCSNDIEVEYSDTGNSVNMVPNTNYDHTAAEYGEGLLASTRCPRASIPGCNEDIFNVGQRWRGLNKKVDEYKCFMVIYTSGPMLHRCLPFQDQNTGNQTLTEALNQSSSALKQLSDKMQVGQFFNRGFGEVRAAWPAILISVITATVVSCIWIFLLRWLLAPIVYMCIFLVLVLLIGLGFIAYRMANDLDNVRMPGDDQSHDQVKVWRAIQWVCWVGAAVYFVLMFWLLKRIRLAITVMKEGSKAFLSAKSLVIIPPVVLLAFCGLTVYFIYVTVYIQTIGDLQVDDFRAAATQTFGGTLVNATISLANSTANLADSLNNNTNSSSTATFNVTTFNTKQAIKGLHAYNFFAFLWAINFCIGYGFFVMALTTCVWYFSASALDMQKLKSDNAEVSAEGKEKHVPIGTVVRAFVIGLRYHLGSLLFGALLIAIIQFIRAVMLYIEQEILEKYKDDVAVKFIIYCINCWLACIERLVKLINKNAYILICIKNNSFCTSAAEAMRILVCNCLRVGALATMSTIAGFVLKLFITATNVLIGYALVKQSVLWQRSDDTQSVESGLFPLCTIFIISYIIAALFIDVYESCTDTVMMCFFVDTDELEGAFLPEELGKLVGQFEQAEKARKAYEDAMRAATHGESAPADGKVVVKEASDVKKEEKTAKDQN